MYSAQKRGYPVITGFSTVFAYIGFGFFMFAAFVSFSIDAASAYTMYATVKGFNLDIFTLTYQRIYSLCLLLLLVSSLA